MPLDQLYFLTGFFVGCYIMFKLLVAYVIYTKQYLTTKHVRPNDISIIGSACLPSGSDWLGTVCLSALLYTGLALGSVVFWPIVVLLSISAYLTKVRERNIGN